MPIRRILVDIETLDPTLAATAKLRVTPQLTGGDGRVLTARSITYQMNLLPTAAGKKYIDLTVNTTGTVGYRFEFERDNGKWDTARAYITAGAEIALSEIITAGGAAGDSLMVYVDGKINDHNQLRGTTGIFGHVRIGAGIISDNGLISVDPSIFDEGVFT